MLLPVRNPAHPNRAALGRLGLPLRRTSRQQARVGRVRYGSNRWLRWLGPSLPHPRLWHRSHLRVATGPAIGVYFAFITPIAQTPLSAALSSALRANVPAAVVATLVNTPPTFGPVYHAAWWVGARVLDEPVDAEQTPGVLTGPPATLQSACPALSGRPKWIVTLKDIGKPLLVDTPIFSIGFSLLACLLVNGVWQRRVWLKRRRRARRCGEADPT